MDSLPLSGRTLLFPVIGHPVRQVRAPAVFNALFAQAGIDALCVGLDLAPHAVVATCRALLQSPSVGGLLVTVPFKKTLAQAADRLGPAAGQVGAVNALRRAADGGIEGDLFDGLGFVRGMQAATPPSPARSWSTPARSGSNPPMRSRWTRRSSPPAPSWAT
jgi:shikimate dehydrogenase